MSYEEVVNKLDEETVSYDIGFGPGTGSFPETMRVSLKVEPANYEPAVAWLKDLIYGSVFNKERSVLLDVSYGRADTKQDSRQTTGCSSQDSAEHSRVEARRQ